MSFVEHDHISIVTQSISVGLAKSKASKHISVNSLPSDFVATSSNLSWKEMYVFSVLLNLTGVSLNVHQLLVLVKLSEEYSNSQSHYFKCNLKLFILVKTPLVVSFRPIFSYDDVLVPDLPSPPGQQMKSSFTDWPLCDCGKSCVVWILYLYLL